MKPLRNRYAAEKLYQAMYCLIGQGPLQQRLEYAADYLLRLNEDDFDNPDLVRRWREIKEDLTWFVPASGCGAIRATTDIMLDYDADKIAGRIFSLSIRVPLNL